MKEEIHLAFDLSWTHLEGRWRLPGSWTGRQYPDLGLFQEVAQIAERGLIDMIFFGDGTGIPNTWRSTRDEAVRYGIGWPRHDMAPYVAAMAQTTKNVGFCITYSSTFMEPFFVARLLNSLDHISNGRMAFNVVTSTRLADGANFGFDQLMAHGDRYDRMDEFVAVCRQLWNSVEPDAFEWDRATGLVVPDPAKVQAINYRGKYFNVAGPLNCVPSPQRSPVLVQAGGSPRGIATSSRFADVIFAAAGKSPAENIAFRKRLDTALAAEGRDPKTVGILWEVGLIIAETKGEALRRKEELLTAIPREAAGSFISHNSGFDFSRVPARFSLHDLNAQIVSAQATPVGFVYELIDKYGASTEMTRDDLLDHGMQYATGYHRTIAGTGRQIADSLEEMFVETGSRGGFMMAHASGTPRDHLAAIDFLVPELQRRGRYRTKYESSTLRDNLVCR